MQFNSTALLTIYNIQNLVYFIIAIGSKWKEEQIPAYKIYETMKMNHFEKIYNKKEKRKT